MDQSQCKFSVDVQRDEVLSSTAFQTVPKRTCDSKARRCSECRSVAVYIFTTRVLPMARSIPPFLINRSNVSKLWVAGSYPTGHGNKYLFNPIVVDRRMYVLARNNAIVALDAKVGAELWIHPTEMRTTLITSRGNYLLAISRIQSERPRLPPKAHLLSRAHPHPARETPLWQQFRFHVHPQRAPCH
jgi:hypothetical protein